MKEIFKKPQLIILSILLLSCKESTSKGGQKDTETVQRIELVIDGNKKTSDVSSILLSGYTSSYFLLSYMSEKDDIGLTISAFIPNLKTGTYQVYDCKSASQCDENLPDNNQTALFQPYPKNPMPSVSLSRSAYFAPQLGLEPLTLTITSIIEEQQLGNPYKTQRIKGQFSGSLAYVEQTQGAYDWHIVGKKTQIEGGFDIICTIR